MLKGWRLVNALECLWPRLRPALGEAFPHESAAVWAMLLEHDRTRERDPSDRSYVYSASDLLMAVAVPGAFVERVILGTRTDSFATAVVNHDMRLVLEGIRPEVTLDAGLKWVSVLQMVLDLPLAKLRRGRHDPKAFLLGLLDERREQAKLAQKELKAFLSAHSIRFPANSWTLISDELPENNESNRECVEGLARLMASLHARKIGVSLNLKGVQSNQVHLKKEDLYDKVLDRTKELNNRSVWRPFSSDFPQFSGPYDKEGQIRNAYATARCLSVIRALQDAGVPKTMIAMDNYETESSDRQAVEFKAV